MFLEKAVYESILIMLLLIFFTTHYIAQMLKTLRIALADLENTYDYLINQQDLKEQFLYIKYHNT